MAFALLLGCQMLGELIVFGAKSFIPAFVFPGPVAGILALLAMLLVLDRQLAALEAVSSALIAYLPLLFVPSAVGVVQYRELIVTWWLPLLLSVLLSTIATMLVTVGVYLLVGRMIGKPAR